MATTFHLTARSGNQKTGPIPVSTTSSDSCPRLCGMWDACYAKMGKIKFHWDKVTGSVYDSVTNIGDFVAKIAELPDGQVWRHNQAGDLPGYSDNDDYIDEDVLISLAEANQNKHGFTYTHKRPEIGDNASLIHAANAMGFTVNISADNANEADRYHEDGFATTLVIERGSGKVSYTPRGNRIVRCPAQNENGKFKVTCGGGKVNGENTIACGGGKPLCGRADRSYIVGFEAHGMGAKRAENVIKLLMAR